MIPRSSSAFTIVSISGCTSGSPPAIETIGAPHSSIAPSTCSTERRFFRISGGYWILPHPAHARLHAKSGSISTRSGNFF